MIEEIGRVIAIDGPWVMVMPQRRSGCGSCGGRGGACGGSTAQVLPLSQVPLRAHNSIHARLGEQVVVRMTESGFLQAVILLYGTPLVTLIIGICVGQWLDHNTATGTELAAIICGLLGLLVGLSWVRYRTHHGRLGAVNSAVTLRRNQEQADSPISTIDLDSGI